MAEVCEGECIRRSLEDEPLTLMRCHSYMKPLKGGSPSVAEHKGRTFVFLLFLTVCSSFHSMMLVSLAVAGEGVV